MPESLRFTPPPPEVKEGIGKNKFALERGFSAQPSSDFSPLSLRLIMLLSVIRLISAQCISSILVLDFVVPVP